MHRFHSVISLTVQAKRADATGYVELPGRGDYVVGDGNWLVMFPDSTLRVLSHHMFMQEFRPDNDDAKQYLQEVTHGQPIS